MDSNPQLNIIYGIKTTPTYQRTTRWKIESKIDSVSKV